MRASFLIVPGCFLLGALAQPACLVANTDCESDDDCDTGRVCQSGECIDSNTGGASGSGGGGAGGSGGGGSGGYGGSGGGPTFESCAACVNTLCDHVWDQCYANDEITFCSSYVQCLDGCATSSCVNQCNSTWGFSSPTLSAMRSCISQNCLYYCSAN